MENLPEQPVATETGADIQLAIAHVILKCPPNITGFYNWSKFTDSPMPIRHNYQTNEEYVRKHWWRLKRVIIDWLAERNQVQS